MSDSVDSIPFNFLPQVLPERGNLVDLDAASVERAVALSQTIPEAARWPSYLALLALEGFATWLEDLAIPVQLERSRARLVQPTQFDRPAAITQVMLNQLRVCLVVVEEVEEPIELPISVVDDPSQAAHCYVAVAVDEECWQTAMQGFLRYDQLAPDHQQPGLNPTYLIPREAFDSDLYHLLLFAIGLKPTAIALPTSASGFSLPAIQQILLQPVVNTASWAGQRIAQLGDEFRQLMDDVVLAGLSPELQPALRSSQPATEAPGASLVTILRELQHQGFEIPEHIYAAYQTIVIANQELRLSLITWHLAAADAEGVMEWSLLVVLEAVRGAVPTAGIQLALRDQHAPLIEKTLLPGAVYEAAQVIGRLDEQFTISLSLPAGDSITLPPFAYQV
jgi:hypothetical protein